MNTEVSYPIKSEFTSGDDFPTIIANDSLNLIDSQQVRRKTSRIHNQRRNTGRIIWNDETKQVEIRDDSSIRKTSNEGSNDKNIQQALMKNSRSIISRFENKTKEPILGTSSYCLCSSTYYGPLCQYRGTGTDLSILEGILNGSLTNYDRTVEDVFNRSTWNDMLVVVDVTGSMQPCSAAVYKWMRLAYDRLNAIKYYVFFNDGDNMPDSLKVIGSTGGIYGTPTTDLNSVLAVMQTAMKNGNGGDAPENDIEAILYGIAQCPNCSNLIHIADNQATPRDMVLLPNVNKPVKVITCQLNSTPVNPALLTIAAQTGGSLHTLEQDIINLSSIPVNGTIVIGGYTYQRTTNGYIRIR
ncbi:unnamed protein product [Rotaria sp. Silwood2]|nr:unnamed protein product [Rotaria sp. Silwood2]